MNERGQYGTPLYGGSLYSSPPWGGAPDETESGWAYHGGRAFHGHEAPSYGRLGRHEAPLGRGGLLTTAENVRGTYGKRSSAVIGVTLFHGISDRDTAAQQIDTQLRTLASIVATAAGADSRLLAPPGRDARVVASDPRWASRVLESRDAINKSPYRSLWDDAVSPMLNEWNAFYSNRQNWYDAVTQIFTSWEDYTQWAERVQDLRSRIKDAGIPVLLTPLAALNKSVQEKLEEAASDVWKVAKYGLYGVLAIGGIFVLSKAAQNLRTPSAVP